MMNSCKAASTRSLVRCRNPDTQLALLDRLAGTDAAVAQYTEKLELLRAAHAQLAAIDALGNEKQRERLQALLDQVRSLPFLHVLYSGFPCTEPEPLAYIMPRCKT